MKASKRILSMVLVILMVFSVCSSGLTALATDGVTLEEVKLEPIARPKVEFTCTPVTRVAKAVNSAEKGNVIVKATPSGVPELSGPHAAEAYAGETPVATEIVFYSPTSGVSVTGFSCNNSTVSFSDIKFENSGKYTIYVENGTANVGDALVFTVDYTWTDGNVYQEKCVSYVEDISTGGSFVEHRVTWKPYNGTSSWYRGYASAITRVLGKGVYYESPIDVGMSQKFGSYDVSNKAFIESGNLTSYYENERVEITNYFSNPRETIDHTLFVTGTPQAHIYVDKSVTSSLTDINLRINSNVGNEVDAHHIRNNDSPNVALGESYIVSGAQTTAPENYETDINAQATVGYYVPERKDFGFDSEHGLYHTITAGARNGGHIITTGFTGAVANIVDGSTYTIINRYYAYFRGSYAYITNSPIVPTVMTFHIVDKTVLREAIDYVLNTDPTDPRVRVQEKGVNPQAWYYNSGFIAFQNAYTDALKVLNNPKALQTEINAKASSLKTAYKNLVLKGAEYKEVDNLTEQANEILKNASCYPASDVALVEEAKDMVVKGYSILYQNAVDTMARNLKYAIDNATTFSTNPDDFTYTVESGSATITGYTGADTDIIIPSKIDGYKVTAIGAAALKGKTEITSVVIPEGVESLDAEAFRGCTALKTVEIPASVKSIGTQAFYYCTALESFNVADGSEYFCTDATGVLYNADKTILVQYPNASSVTEYVIPDTVETIGDYAFCYCVKILKVTIPDSVKTVGNYAFRGSSKITTINMGNNIEVIKDFAFHGLYRMTSIELPETLTSIGEYAFNECKIVKTLVIPDGVTTIGKNAFNKCSGLTSVEIGKGLEVIDNYAFNGCTSLKTVTIPRSVKNINFCAFYQDTAITDVYYGADEASWNKIVIDSYNEPLTSATIHFADIPTNPEDFTYEIIDGKVTITGYTGSDTEVIIPSTIEGYPVISIGGGAFRNCDSLTSVTIPDSVTSIGNSAFSYCDSLTSVTIPDSVTSIGDSAFY